MKNNWRTSNICVNKHDCVAHCTCRYDICFTPLHHEIQKAQTHKLISASFSGIQNKNPPETFQTHSMLIFFCSLKPEWGLKKTELHHPVSFTGSSGQVLSLLLLILIFRFQIQKIQNYLLQNYIKKEIQRIKFLSIFYLLRIKQIITL